ncbi:MAG: GMC family oxidoreductase [Myxococcales bacterium]|nr:GMC family oxidoreductase [Myxococcales bacterium]
MSDQPAPHDVVIVGSGAAGGWVAKDLSEAGLRVLVLEAGPERALETLSAGDSAGAMLVRLARRLRDRQPLQRQHPAYHRLDPDLFVDDRDEPYAVPPGRPFVWIRGRQVGGRTLTWSRMTQRLSAEQLADWPVAYDELAPYYERVERFLGVCGGREGVDDLPDGAVAAPPAWTAAEQRFAAEVERRLPGTRVLRARGVPVQDGDLPAGRWPRHTSQGSTLLAALDSGRVELITGATALGVELGEGGRASGVRYHDARSRCPQIARARAVVLCASTIETIRLLLGSRSARHPNGLGNARGLLGRGLMDHVTVSATAEIRGVRADHAAGRVGGANGFIVLPSQMPRPRRFAVWGAAGRSMGALPIAPLSEPLAQLAERVRPASARVLLVAQGEVAARPENRVSLDPLRRDARGVPLARIEFSWSDAERARFVRMRACLVDLLAAGRARVRSISGDLPSPGLFVHELGGAPMGRDPRVSVLDPYGCCWEANNVYVCDGSAFPSSGWQGPALTIMALAARVAAHLAGELRAGRY